MPSQVPQAGNLANKYPTILDVGLSFTSRTDLSRTPNQSISWVGIPAGSKVVTPAPALIELCHFSLLVVHWSSLIFSGGNLTHLLTGGLCQTDSMMYCIANTEMQKAIWITQMQSWPLKNLHQICVFFNNQPSVWFFWKRHSCHYILPILQGRRKLVIREICFASPR